jgi:thioredoxin-related protein
MKKLLLLIIFSPLPIMAQNNGIQFEQNLNWEQVKAKAKKENKYIFLDCYATWCAPCKRMDKEVYTNDTVGNFFNKNFISVKIQMDETEKDTKKVQSWRKDAGAISRQYRILAYPTYVFLSPEGSVVHMETGFKPPSDFLTLAQIATVPGKVYNNPHATYDRLVADYKKGKKDYSKMPYMFKTALKLKEIEVAKTLARDYSNYVIGLKNEDLYTKENIEFFATVISSKSKFFHLFFPDGRRIDSTVNKKGYAENIVDEVILTEDVEPFIQMKASGMQIMGAKPDSRPEPEWGKLYQIIADKYSADYAKRNVLDAKIIWHERQQNPIYTAYFIQRWEKYGLDTTNEKTDLRLNKVAWDIFIRATDKVQINAAINWMQGVVRRSGSINPSWAAATTDTYACLLYKAGKKEEAIQWEKKAINTASPAAIKEFEERVDKMKKGEQLWP